MNEDQLRQAFRILGSRGGKAPKTITDADRERRREWGRGLAALKAKKKGAASILSRFAVIDTQDQRWTYHAETPQHAVTLARCDGIDAVSAEGESKP